MVRLNDQVALFNTEKTSTQDYQDDPSLKVDHFALTVPMSTYLVAMIVCDYESVSQITDTEVRVRD